MPNLELKFQVHDKGFVGIGYRKSSMIGYYRQTKRFTNDDLKEACKFLRDEMRAYNKRVDQTGKTCRGGCDG